MKIRSAGNIWLKEMLKHQRVFICNEWEEVEDELAELILTSY